MLFQIRKRKKLLLLLIVVLMLCSCSEKKDGITEDSKDNKTNNETVNNDGKKDENTDTPTYDVKGKTGLTGSSSSNVYCSIPLYKGLSFDDGFSKGLFEEYSHRALATCLTCEYDKATDYDHCLEDFSNCAVSDVENICRSDSIEYKKTEKKTINGIDTIHFVGTMRETRDSFPNNDADLFATGYVFVIDNTVVGVWGFVYKKDQPQESIDFVTETVDFMMNSITIEKVRDESGNIIY